MPHHSIPDVTYLVAWGHFRDLCVSLPWAQSLRADCGSGVNTLDLWGDLRVTGVDDADGTWTVGCNIHMHCMCVGFLEVWGRAGL